MTTNVNKMNSKQKWQYDLDTFLSKKDVYNLSILNNQLLDDIKKWQEYLNPLNVFKTTVEKGISFYGIKDYQTISAHQIKIEHNFFLGVNSQIIINIAYAYDLSEPALKINLKYATHLSSETFEPIYDEVETKRPYLPQQNQGFNFNLLNELLFEILDLQSKE